jgi:hypothetical protein
LFCSKTTFYVSKQRCCASKQGCFVPKQRCFAGLRLAPDGDVCEMFHKLGTPAAVYFFTHDLASLTAASRILSGKP